MRYIFQESRIWDGNNRVDVNGNRASIKARDEEGARRRLPKPGLGRTWILVHTEFTKKEPANASNKS